jgi:hypothetical protein
MTRMFQACVQLEPLKPPCLGATKRSLRSPSSTRPTGEAARSPFSSLRCCCRVPWCLFAVDSLRFEAADLQQSQSRTYLTSITLTSSNRHAHPAKIATIGQGRPALQEQPPSGSTDMNVLDVRRLHAQSGSTSELLPQNPRDDLTYLSFLHPHVPAKSRSVVVCIRASIVFGKSFAAYEGS